MVFFRGLFVVEMHVFLKLFQILMVTIFQIEYFYMIFLIANWHCPLILLVSFLGYYSLTLVICHV